MKHELNTLTTQEHYAIGLNVLERSYNEPTIKDIPYIPEKDRNNIILSCNNMEERAVLAALFASFPYQTDDNITPDNYCPRTEQKAHEIKEQYQ